jgi:hypothetical protein
LGGAILEESYWHMVSHKYSFDRNRKDLKMEITYRVENEILIIAIKER